MTTPDAITRRSDAGESVTDIAAAEGVTPGYVYRILRELRPDRSRKIPGPRSARRPMILGLAAQKMTPDRIAVNVKCSTAYVYRILGEAKE